jgi:hypothetical protein
MSCTPYLFNFSAKCGAKVEIVGNFVKVRYRFNFYRFEPITSGTWSRGMISHSHHYKRVLRGSGVQFPLSPFFFGFVR